ncbi:hypothetical protein JZ751_009024 [Albula glossodonta]|uniref:Uncharacterized protein n=1 Tax=Albula glossodonta TaxID=121402 RepID=A0A8T2P8J6_9TELE|nr:hypothetical protein JZ751_009024 [Albula glossodonta]
MEQKEVSNGPASNAESCMSPGPVLKMERPTVSASRMYSMSSLLVSCGMPVISIMEKRMISRLKTVLVLCPPVRPTCRMSMSCRRSSPSLNIIPMVSLDSVSMKSKPINDVNGAHWWKGLGIPAAKEERVERRESCLPPEPRLAGLDRREP